jgi:HAD superfamily hydrolase (TIGR01484 family)
MAASSIASAWSPDSSMRPLREFPLQARREVRFVLCDIDDTLTDGGRLTARAYEALERLDAAGLTVVPVTGRPAGWCDLIARLWPVAAVVGENGAFYFAYDREARRMARRFWKTPRQRREDRECLALLETRILAEVQGAAIAADQGFREADLAIDYREDVMPLAHEAIARIVAIFEAAGAQAKISSIHVNGWFGDYDKLVMSRRLLEERFGVGSEAARERVLFVGDSPNDAPMFGYFPHSVGVANLRAFAGRLAAEPAWVTEAPGGAGFAELAAALLAAR